MLAIIKSTLREIYALFFHQMFMANKSVGVIYYIKTRVAPIIWTIQMGV